MERKEIITKEELNNLIIKLNNLRISRKSHLKKYYHIKKIHNNIISSMDNYFEKDKYNLSKELKKVVPYLEKELNINESQIKSYFDFKEDDLNILSEIIFYKNHPHMISITEEYIAKKKFKNPENIKMLEAMNNSYVGLFQITNIDTSNYYIELEDIFTKKQFKIIDETLIITNELVKQVYLYTRIITYDDISFMSNINITIIKDDKELNAYINNIKNLSKSNLARLLELYALTKNNNYKKDN